MAGARQSIIRCIWVPIISVISITMAIQTAIGSTVVSFVIVQV
jgi:hypothetical protein